MPALRAVLAWLALAACYGLLVSGAIYDVVMEAPAAGLRVDAASGRVRRVAILAGRVSAQARTEAAVIVVVFLVLAAAAWTYHRVVFRLSITDALSHLSVYLHLSLSVSLSRARSMCLKA